MPQDQKPEGKEVKAKPHFYAVCLLPLQQIAKDMGYNLVVHGSLNRDFDLIAIPWVNEPKPEVELIKALDMYLRGTCYEDGTEERGYLFKVLPGGRRAYVINLNRGGKWNNFLDEQWYLDISVTPSPAPQPIEPEKRPKTYGQLKAATNKKIKELEAKIKELEAKVMVHETDESMIHARNVEIEQLQNRIAELEKEKGLAPTEKTLPNADRKEWNRPA